jgi:aspartate/methionine/tyrosine aminotransferase
MTGIRPAKRIEKVEEYYFSRKLKEIREMNMSGYEVINLGIGSPDLSPADEVVETLSSEARNGRNHAYQPYTGISELRLAFAEWYKKFYRVVLDPATEILPLMGSKEGIMHIAMAFLNPGDIALVPNPGYPVYRSASQLSGAIVQDFDLLEDKSWMPDLTKLEKNLPENARLMWINYPNMPTGSRGLAEGFPGLIEFAVKHNILLINDNPYSFVLNDTPSSLLAIEGAKDVVIELNSLSKSHNMAGWRVGMVAAKEEFIQYILRVKSNMDSGMFKPVQLAAVKALQADEAWYRNQNEIYRERRKHIREIFDLLGCSYEMDQSGMFVWAKIPESAGSGQEMADELLVESRVFITPGFIFGSAGDRYLRASLCQPVEVIAEAKNRIQN